MQLNTCVQIQVHRYVVMMEWKYHNFILCPTHPYVYPCSIEG